MSSGHSCTRAFDFPPALGTPLAQHSQSSNAPLFPSARSRKLGKSGCTSLPRNKIKQPEDPCFPAERGPSAHSRSMAAQHLQFLGSGRLYTSSRSSCQFGRNSSGLPAAQHLSLGFVRPSSKVLWDAAQHLKRPPSRQACGKSWGKPPRPMAGAQHIAPDHRTPLPAANRPLGATSGLQRAPALDEARSPWPTNCKLTKEQYICQANLPVFG